jgi:hypothetical protein
MSTLRLRAQCAHDVHQLFGFPDGACGSCPVVESDRGSVNCTQDPACRMAQNCIAPVAGSMNQITGRNALIGADPITGRAL